MDSYNPRGNVQLMLQVARLYYEEDLTQNQIAKIIGFSRPTVSRLLRHAKESGVVSIVISHPMERLFNMEEQLKAAFGLKHVRVTEVIDTGVIESIGKAAASLISELGGNRKIIAVSNGRSIAATVLAMPPQHWENSTIVQMIGAVGNGLLMEDSPSVCRQFAMKVGATYAQMPVPLILDDPELAQLLRREEQIAASLTLASHADIALVGVGATSDSSAGRILDRYLDEATTKAIIDSGSVGHISGHHFDKDGRHVWTPLCDRTMALDLDSLKKVPYVVGVAGGPEKITAINAAIKGKYINCLVIDYQSARSLLDLKKATGKRT